MSRPRNSGNRPLPPNLYHRKDCGSFRYKHPVKGSWHPMGTNRNEAIKAATKLNGLLLPDSDLVGQVLAGGTSFGAFMDERWFAQILPERALAERTLERYVSECKLLREHWGDTPIEELRTEQLAAVLNELDPGPANKRRERLTDIFDEAIRDGLIDTNPASILRVRNTGPKKRQRLNLAQYRAIHAQAPVWLQNAMDIALLTLQRESDVLTMRFDEIKDDTLYVIQQKTRKYDTGYLSIQIDATLQPLPRPYRVAADHPRAAAEGRATGHPESPLERGQGQAFGG